MSEMVSMAIDFDEESLHKRVLSIKFAKESAFALLKRMKEKEEAKQEETKLQKD